MKKEKSKEIRLQKYIADCGITSRRKAETLIAEGKVAVNEQIVTEMGIKVNPELDVISVDGKIIDLQAIDHVYLVMNKPRSYVTTVSDPEGRKTVMDLVPISTRVYPVGRLDYLSEGLLIFTNDGDLANKIIHPRFGIVKTYEVKVFGKINDNVLRSLREGIHVDGSHLKPKSVRVIEQLPNKTWLEFRLEEGKNREIRKICEGNGVTIDKLKRVAIGSLNILGVQPGKWNYYTKPELLKAIGLNKDGTLRPNAGEFQSAKKSIDVKKFSKKQKDAKLASSSEFSRYRKEEYYNTLKIQAEAKRKKVEIAKEEEQVKEVGRKSRTVKNLAATKMNEGKKNFRR